MIYGLVAICVVMAAALAWILRAYLLAEKAVTRLEDVLRPKELTAQEKLEGWQAAMLREMQSVGEAVRVNTVAMEENKATWMGIAADIAVMRKSHEATEKYLVGVEERKFPDEEKFAM